MLNVINESDVEDYEEVIPLNQHDEICSIFEGQYPSFQHAFDEQLTDISDN